MSPVILAGDFVFAFKRLLTSYRKGDTVVVHHPQLGNVIKRVCEIEPHKGVRLVGENELSTTSEELGWQKEEAIRGRVIFHIKQR